MKKLITVSDVESALSKQQVTIAIDDNTLITPAAKDLAKAKDITFIEQISLEPTKPCAKTEVVGAIGGAVGVPSTGNQVLDLLQSILVNKVGGSVASDGLVRDKDASGLQIVRAQDVDFDEFDTGVPGANVQYKELIGYSDSPNISAGLLKIVGSKFPWKLLYDEIDIVLEGELNITINGVKRTAKAGDVLYVPKNSDVIWGADEYAKVFYVTYPANWAETMA
ncbi:cupin domain-containing protein [uncultured Veillonella sp.]|uniref:cupin domain-containing protein n=1 Tax=uncultured Veillonella sp. TaxID=159268 RepID=UPI002637DDE1|nr:cupin domain-containing protein [uncultured Veillonella sp.]